MQGQKTHFSKGGLVTAVTLAVTLAMTLVLLVGLGSASAEEPSPEVFTVALVSDMNGSYGSTAYGAHVHNAVTWLIDTVKPDLVLSAGDMVAGQRGELDYPAMWSSFHKTVTLPLASAG